MAGRVSCEKRASGVCEFVADAVHGQHVSWLARIGFELAAKILDVRVDRAIERLDLVASDPVEQLARVNTRPGWRISIASISNSVVVRSIERLPTFACMRGTSSVTPAARITSA